MDVVQQVPQRRNDMRAFEEIGAQMPFGSCNISGSGISYHQSPPVIMNMVQNGI